MPPVDAGHPVVALAVHRFEGVTNRVWAFSQMGLSRFALKRIPGIGFVKMLGTGTGEGFTPVPNLGVYALMTTWPSLDKARESLALEPVFQRYRDHAAERYVLYLRAIASRGRWDGVEPFPIEKPQDSPLPMAVLTRATVKARHVIRFWRAQPDVSDLVRGQSHMLFKIGMGEIPWFHQVTFSVWDDVPAMKAFAYGLAAHGEAVRQVRQGQWFKEELYARFGVLAQEGTWGGRDPLRTAATADPAAWQPTIDQNLTDVRTPPTMADRRGSPPGWST